MGQNRSQEPNPNQREVVKVSDIEDVLTRIPGILAARLVVNDWGAIEEIHILATTERGAKQLVRDVESTLTARWGIRVDHKKISVAQLENGSALPPVRLKLAGVTASADAIACSFEVRVQLVLVGHDDLSFEGVASGVNATSLQPKIVAAATLSALDQAVRPGYRFALEDARLISLAGRELAVVLFALYGPGSYHQLLAGARPVFGDPVEAVAQACLQGANRLMERLVRRRCAPAMVAEVGNEA